MKKLFLIILSYTALFFTYSCSDSQYTDKYTDPEETSTVTCEKLMTGVFYTGRTYAMASYDRLFEIETEYLGHSAQVTGFLNNKNKAYAGLGVEYNNRRWKNFYSMLSQFNLLKKTYDNLSEAEQTENKIYLDCAQIYVYEQLEEMIDLWGDVPYTAACTLQLTGDMTTAKPAYDKATDLYTQMLSDLKTIATELGSMTVTSEMSSNMESHDYINNGDITKWIKFANGLRMRIAMRCATQGDLIETGRAALKEVFDGSTSMISSNDDEILIDVASSSGDFEMLDNMAIRDGWETWNGECNRASQAMFDALNYGTDNVDPRFEVMYDPSPLEEKINGMRTYVYHAMSPKESIQTQSDNYDNNEGNYYAAVDSATFSRNNGYINPLITAAEVDLTKAEAIVRGYITGTIVEAKAAFVKGIEESTNFYYKENAASSYRTAVTEPSTDKVKAYAESCWDEDNPVKCICTQEWLNYSLAQMTQAYFNLRRTGYPQLDFVSFKSITGVSCYLPLDRLEYPSDEINYNADNLKDELNTNFNGTDTWYQKIFWSKDVGTWFNVISVVQ